MKKVLIIGLWTLMMSVVGQAQNLEDVLSSIQERHRAVEQKGQLENHIWANAIADQQLIDWTGLTADFPATTDLTGKSIEEKLVLLNQAIIEFRRISVKYYNVRPEDLVAGNKMGSLQYYHEEDFDLLGRATILNYHQVLLALAYNVSRLQVLPWTVKVEDEVASVTYSSDEMSRPSSVGVGDVPGSSIVPRDGTNESVELYLIYTEDEPEEGAGGSTEKALGGYKHEYFVKEWELLSQVPSRSDQLDGKVAVLGRNQWTPITAGSYSSATQGMADKWNPIDGRYHVDIAVDSPTGVITRSAPGFTINLSWTDTPATSSDVDQRGFAQGFAVYETEYAANGGDYWFANASWNKKWGVAVGPSDEGDAFGGPTCLSRPNEVVFVPQFTKGINSNGILAKIEATRKMMSPPSGDALPVLHPSPGILVGVPLGVGLEGGAEGWIGMLRIEPKPYGTSPRFDYISNLRFIGLKQDFHVVYNSWRSGNDSIRASSLPAERPPGGTGNGNDQTFLPSGWENTGDPETADTASAGQDFFEAWDAPRLQQVVSRDFIANVTYQDHYEATVKVYRRPTTAGTVDRTSGEIVATTGLSLVRTLVFSNPDMTSTPDYPAVAQKIEVADGTMKYTVSQSKFESYSSSNAVEFVTSDNAYSKKLTFTGSEDNFSLQTTVLTKVDGHTVSIDEISSQADENWYWWGYRAPKTVVSTRGTETTTVTNTFGSDSAGNQNGRYPDSTTVASTESPDSSYTWNNTNGLLTNMTNGDWSVDTAFVGGLVKSQTKLGGSALSTTWVEWPSTPSAKEGRVVKTYSAPDANASVHTDTSVDWTELLYGDGLNGSWLGLPHELTRANGTQGKWDWIEFAGYISIYSDGVFAGDVVQQGTRTTTYRNNRGYTTGTEAERVIGGAFLQVAGETLSEETAWGAPTKSTSYGTGLVSSWTYDGVGGVLSRLNSYTDKLGVQTAGMAYDDSYRLTGYTWNGAAGTIAYNTGGLGVDTTLAIPNRAHEGSQDFDLSGRVTSVTSSTGTGEDLATASATYAYPNASTTSVTHTNSVTSASTTTQVDTDSGSLKTQVGNTMAFGGLTHDEAVVDSGWLKTKAAMTGLTARFQTTWTDAWGRVRQIKTPSTTGTGEETTTYTYSDPSETTNFVKIDHPSGMKMVTEIEPWSTTQGVVSRSGIDIDGDGSLGALDRFTETVTLITGGTTMQSSTKINGDSYSTVVQSYTPSSRVNVTTYNGGEEIVTSTPNFANKTVQVKRTRNSVDVTTTDTTFNSLGQADLINHSGVGIPTIISDPTFRKDGSLSGTSYTKGTKTTTASFGPTGLLTAMTVPILGNLSASLTYDANGVATLVANGTTATQNADGTSSSLTGTNVMDRSRSTAVEGGNLVQTIDPAAGSDTKIEVAPSGVKTKHDYAGSNDPVNTYKAGGRPDTHKLGRGEDVVYTHSADGAQDLNQVDYPAVGGVNGASARTVKVLTRTTAGEPKTVSEESDSIEVLAKTLSYDKHRLSQEEYTAGVLGGYEVKTTYSDSGQIEDVEVFLNDSSLHKIDYSYTGAESDEISGVSAGTFAASYARDSDRDITNVTRGTVVQNWGRGTAGRITSADVTGVTGAPSFTYSTFDAQGRRDNVVTNRGTWDYDYRGGVNGDGQLASAVNVPLGANYTYGFDDIGRKTNGGNAADPLNQFVSLDHATTKTISFFLDPAAKLWVNNIEVTPVNGKATASVNRPIPSNPLGDWVSWQARGVLEGAGDAGAAPHAQSEVEGHLWFPPPVEGFTYDADGNRESTSLWDYTWDGRNRLVRASTNDYNLVATPQGWDLSFDYDSEGRRYRKTVKRYKDGVVVEHKDIIFVWDGWDLVYERHNDGNGNMLLERKYVWGPDISSQHGGAGGAGGLLMIREGDGSSSDDYYPIYDGSGHVTGLTNSSGNLVAEYWWGPFGELIEASGPMADVNPWRYATKYYDVETGLYYFGFRYYDPASGQWLNREPLGEDESLNLYAYCHNDPVNHVDVLGLDDVRLDEEVFEYGQRTWYVQEWLFGWDGDRTYLGWAKDGRLIFTDKLVRLTGLTEIPLEAAQYLGDHDNAHEFVEAIKTMARTKKLPPKPEVRVMGAVKVVGATVEATLAAPVMLAPEPTGASKVGAWLVFGHAIDLGGTGVNEVMSGYSKDTLTFQGVVYVAKKAGASEEFATSAARGVEMGLSFSSAGFPGVVQNSTRITPSLSTSSIPAASLVEDLGRVSQGGGGFNLALGLARHGGNGSPFLLTNFAKNTGSKTYFDLYGTWWPGSMDKLQSTLTKAMNNSKSIKFNLDQVDMIRFREFTKNPIFSDKNITNWELYQVLSNPKLLQKTTFFEKGGKSILAPGL